MVQILVHGGIYTLQADGSANAATSSSDNPILLKKILGSEGNNVTMAMWSTKAYQRYCMTNQ